MKALPSRLKIALLSAGISGLVLVVFGVVMWLLIYQVRLEAVDREIRSLGTRHPGLFAGRGNYERLAGSLESTFGDDYTNHIILLIKDAGTKWYTQLLTINLVGISVDQGPDGLLLTRKAAGINTFLQGRRVRFPILAHEQVWIGTHNSRCSAQAFTIAWSDAIPDAPDALPRFITCTIKKCELDIPVAVTCPAITYIDHVLCF